MVRRGGMVIAKLETLDVLGTLIRSDLRWDNHVFNVSKEAAKCLGFLKRCKKSSLLPIYALSMSPTLDRKWNTIHTYGQVRLKRTFDFVDRIQSRALMLIGDDRVTSSITSLGHLHNVSFA